MKHVKEYLNEKVKWDDELKKRVEIEYEKKIDEIIISFETLQKDCVEKFGDDGKYYLRREIYYKLSRIVTWLENTLNRD